MRKVAGGWAATLSVLAEDDGELEAAVERDRRAEQRGGGLPSLHVGLQRVRMHDNVVRNHECARLELPARELEQLLVHLVRGVEEDEVEDVVDHRQCLAGV